MTSCRDIANAVNEWDKSGSLEKSGKPDFFDPNWDSSSNKYIAPAMKEMAHCSSINSLIQKLCEHLFASCLKKVQHCQAHHPHFDIKLQQEKTIKCFKKIAYQILLKFIDTNVILSNVPMPGFTEIDCILAYVYNLRMSRHFDDANRLETLLNRLKGKDGIISDDIKVCLLFFVCLTESGESKHNYNRSKIDIPRAVLEKDELNILPLEPLMYGDTRTCRKNFYYMHYPREIFEVDMTISYDDFVNENMTIFESCPGFDRNGNHLFSIPCYSSGMREKQPFMGALYNPEIIPAKNGLDLHLDLPDIKDRNFNRPLRFKFCIQPSTVKNKQKHNLLSEDEGFIETETPISCGSGLVKYEDVWESALKIESRNYFTWETIGCYAAKKEKPYLTEAGPAATEMLHKAHLYELYLMDPSFSVAPTVTVTHKSLIRDVFYLLTGVPSKTFLFMKEQTMFTVKSGIHLPGLTPACTANLLERFVDAGAEYCRLEKFASEVCLNVCYGKGLVMQAFKGGLQQYLHYYQAMVLYLSQFQFSLLQLDHTFGKLRRQLSFIAQLCKCSSTSNINSHSSLPQGLELLTYLYQHAFETWGQDHGIAMVFLLKSACVPYLRYLKQWMFEGICNDPYNEFHVEINDMFVNIEDESYWSKGFIWKTLDVKNAIPLFLSDIAKHIFVCGKSLNLLRLCCPQHHMCHTQEVAPSLILSTSEKTSETNKESSERYKAKMMQIFEQKQQLKDEIAKEKEEEKQRHLAKVNQNIRWNSEKLKRNQEKSRELGKEKKRQCMEDLKIQIEDNKARKMKEKELLDEEKRQEAEKNVKEAEQLKIAREEIIAKYERLTSDVVTETQTLKWRADRWKLQQERTKCLEEFQKEVENENKNVDEITNKNFNETDALNSEIDNVLNEKSHSIEPPAVENITSCLMNSNITHEIPKENEIEAAVTTSSETVTDHIAFVDKTSHIKCPIADKQNVMHDHHTNETNYIQHHQDKMSDRTCNTLKETNKVIHLPDEESTICPANSNHNLHAEESSSNKSLNDFENNKSSVVAKEFLGDVIEISQNNNDSVLTKENISESDKSYTCINISEELVTPTSDVDIWKTAIRDNSTNTVLKYRGRNLHGHSSDSVIEKLIYYQVPQKEKVNLSAIEEKDLKNTSKLKGEDEDIQEDIISLKSNTYSYRKDFDMFDKAPISDIIMNIPKTKKQTHVCNCTEDIKSSRYIPLPVLLNRSLLPLLQTQIHLVNKSIVDYFMIDLDINDHFTALRNYYFFQDGEFGQMLSQLLFDKVVQCSSPAELLNPPTLNSILARALASTIHGDSPFADNLSFAVKYIPTVFPHNAASILSCLELRYKVSWPLNIVITDKCFDHYNCLLGLLLQVKRTFWLLNDIWYHLKTVERYHSAYKSLQCRQLQLCRHEMQHFARVMQSYMASQVLQVTWNDFQNALQHKVYSLDDLRNVHLSYLKKACFRCLLTKKAAPVMKIIQDVFNVITKFHSQLLVASWQVNPQSHQMEHPSFPLLMTSHKIFKEYSSFLYRAWLYRAVGAPSLEEVNIKRIPAVLARVLSAARC